MAPYLSASSVNDKSLNYSSMSSTCCASMKRMNCCSLCSTCPAVIKSTNGSCGSTCPALLKRVPPTDALMVCGDAGACCRAQCARYNQYSPRIEGEIWRTSWCSDFGQGACGSCTIVQPLHHRYGYILPCLKFWFLSLSCSNSKIGILIFTISLVVARKLIAIGFILFVLMMLCFAAVFLQNIYTRGTTCNWVLCAFMFMQVGTFLIKQLIW